MRTRNWSLVGAALAVVATLGIGLSEAQAQNVDSFGANYGRGYQPLFNNYFTQGYANQAEAGMYISPTGVPGNVGHTYVTYQPFWPHEYTWRHHDRYHSYYDNGRGLNRTSAHYSSPPVRTTVNRIYRMIEIPR